MHELFARSVGEDSDDSTVGLVRSTLKTSHLSQDFLQFRREALMVPHIRSKLKEGRTY